MVDTLEESVRVIASDPSDRWLMGDLLAGKGLHVETEEEMARGGSSARRRATLVCHRAASDGASPALSRAAWTGRVIVFSDCTSERPVVDALEAGAHQYFDITESRPVLRARLSAALRSHTRRADRELIVPPFRFDLGKRRAWREGRAVGLTPREFDFAYYLFSNRGRDVASQELMTAVWSLPPAVYSRRIDTAAYRVRKKLGLEDGDGWRLKRLRGTGFRLIGPGETL